MKMNKKGQEGSIVLATIMFFLIISLPFILFSIINYNEYAVIKHFSGSLDNNILDNGINYVGFGTAIKVNNQIRNYEIIVEAPSKDFQSVKLDLNMNIKIKRDKTYEFLKNYPSEQKYMEYLNNKIQEKIKTIIIKYNAEEILVNRLTISKELYEECKNIKELEYFEFNDLSIKNIDFKEEFNAVLEKKAQVEFERGWIKQQKENMELLKENMKIMDINTYFKYKMIEKWDGKAALIISDSLIKP